MELGKDVTAEVTSRSVTIKGKKGSLNLAVNSEVEVKLEGNIVTVAPRSRRPFCASCSRTARARSVHRKWCEAKCLR